MNNFAQFKNYDYILNNKTILLSEKIFALIELWNKISTLDFEELNLNETINLVDWALLHTMNIVLTAEWTHYMDLFQAKLLNSIESASEIVKKVSKGFDKSFDKIVYVIKNTWGISILDVIIKKENVGISKEIVDFFDKEEAHLVSVRLIKLCESQCEDLALNLATTFLNYLKFMEKAGEKVKITPDQILFIFDIRIALLYKWGRIKVIEEALSQLNHKDFQLCIDRFLNKKPNLLKIWKYSKKIAMIMIENFLEKIVIYAEHRRLFIEILKTYVNLGISLGNLKEIFPKIRKLCNSADSQMLLTICDLFKNFNNKDIYSFTVEMYIKSLTVDMNELEVQKVNEKYENAEEEERSKELTIITSRLASTLSSLAEYMKEKVKIARECALTAFSLEPTVDRLYILEDLAKKSGLPVLDKTFQWKCKMHPLSSPTPSDENLKECLECREYMCKLQPDIPMKANLALYEAIQTLDLPETICDDLIICISNPRYQVLSWYLPWMVLYRLCVMYLKDPLRIRNYVTKLNFLDIDYSKFDRNDRGPVSPFAGVEKGFEKYLNTDYNGEDSEEELTSENCAIDGDDYDPNSMESLKKILGLGKNEVENEDLDEKVEKEDEEMREWTHSGSGDGKVEKGFKKLKNKFCFFNKEGKKKKKSKKDGELSLGTIKKKSRCSIFGRKKSKFVK